MFWVLIIVLVLAVLSLIANAFFQVPTNCFAVMTIFKKQTGRVCDEGFNLRIPLIEKWLIFSRKPIPLEVSVKFVTKDGRTLVCELLAQFKRDPEVRDDRGKVVCVEVSDEFVLKATTSEIKARLSALGGVYNSEEFIGKKMTISAILNMFLRVGTPYHRRHDNAHCGIDGCAYGPQIDVAELILFYDLHWKKVKEVLDGESDEPEDRSSLENRLGIDVIKLNLDEVVFSEETRKAMEEEGKVHARAAAMKTYEETSKKMKLLFPDAPHQAVLDEAGRFLDPDRIKKTIFSGELGVLGALAQKLGGK